jgi:hypothetical protein
LNLDKLLLTKVIVGIAQHLDEQNSISWLALRLCVNPLFVSGCYMMQTNRCASILSIGGSIQRSVGGKYEEIISNL